MEELSGRVYNPIGSDGEGGTARMASEKGRSYTTARACRCTTHGLVLLPRAGIPAGPRPCHRTADYPNAINIPSMPSPILRPGETYSERQFFAFKW
ncbi:MAG: hypothetical protein ACLR7Z_19630 [Bilophila wadsworthia]